MDDYYVTVSNNNSVVTVLCLETLEAAFREEEFVAIAKPFVGDGVQDAVYGGGRMRKKNTECVRLPHGKVMFIDKTQQRVGRPAQTKDDENDEQSLRQLHLRSEIGSRVGFLGTRAGK